MSVRRILVGVMVALVLSACGTVTAPDSDTADGGATAETPTRQTVFANDLAVGDCWDPLDFDVAGGQENELVSADVELVPCEEAHTAEVYAVFDVEGTEYPGDEELWTECSLQCYERFEPFVGIEYEASALDVNLMTPCRKSWEFEDDRTAICSVIDLYGDPLTGSMAGSMR